MGWGTPLPAVLGHEGVGRIQALGENVEGFEIGDRVVMSFGACGLCSSCLQGMPAYRRRIVDFNLFGRRLDGTSPSLWAAGPSPGIIWTVGLCHALGGFGHEPRQAGGRSARRPDGLARMWRADRHGRYRQRPRSRARGHAGDLRLRHGGARRGDGGADRRLRADHRRRSPGQPPRSGPLAGRHARHLQCARGRCGGDRQARRPDSGLRQHRRSCGDRAGPGRPPPAGQLALAG